MLKRNVTSDLNANPRMTKLKNDDEDIKYRVKILNKRYDSNLISNLKILKNCKCNFALVELSLT